MMRKIAAKLIFFLSVVCALNFVFAEGLPTTANLPFIDKAKIRLALAPGKEGLGEVNVENPTSEERHMRLYLEDWYYLADGSGAKEFLPAGTLPSSCASWISFSPAEFTIPAFGKQRISYSVKVPADATGGHYAVLFFETQLSNLSIPGKEREAGMDLRVRIATLFYVEAEGATRRKANLSNLSVKNNASGGIAIAADLENSGNVDISAAGSFHVIDNQGMVYARGEFNKVYTFPGDKAKFSARWDKPIPKGEYDLVLTFDLGKAAQEAGGISKGPVVTKEVSLSIDSTGKVLRATEAD